MARVSNPANQLNTEIEGLLKYCMRNCHWSIFEMSHMAVEINCPCSIATQILRHRSFSFQMFSQRYAEVEFDIELPKLRSPHPKNRQMSLNDLDEGLVNQLQEDINKHFKDSNILYKKLLKKGVAKECARAVLPQQSPTRMYMVGSIRSWIHYLQVRTDPSTQEEHRKVALEIKKIFQDNLPIIGKLID
jgi:thymidylate synthase (FAD)